MLSLVVSAGRSSINFQLWQVEHESLQLSGILERIGEQRTEPVCNLGDGSKRRRMVDAPGRDQVTTRLPGARQTCSLCTPFRH